MNPLLEVVSASFSYGNNGNIFEDLNFHVDPGDVFCILGANGTGKTTLIKCLNGLMKLNSGSIFLKGKGLYSLNQAEIARNIGYIPQIHNSTFPFTVLDVVLMGRAPYLDIFSHPSKKDYKIALNSLKTLNILEMKDKPYTEISGGEQQLVFLARILTQQTRILILDEPTSHLDFGNQIRTLNIIEKLADKGLAIIMSSHFPDHALMSSNKVAILKDKKFIDIGSPDQVINEDNMKKAYGIKVKIMEFGNRKACIPIKI
ncbi:MAG: ABC transporter ATP-binding protein [Methanomicrobiales archaeon]